MTSNIIPFKTSKAEGLFVEVPDGAKNFSIGTAKGSCNFKYLCMNGCDSLPKLPPGNYRILGMVGELSEEVCKTLIEVNLHVMHTWKLRKFAKLTGASETWLVVVKEY